MPKILIYKATLHSNGRDVVPYFPITAITNTGIWVTPLAKALLLQGIYFTNSVLKIITLFLMH